MGAERPRAARGGRGKGLLEIRSALTKHKFKCGPRVHGSSYFCFEAPGHYPCVYDIIGERYKDSKTATAKSSMRMRSHPQLIMYLEGALAARRLGAPRVGVGLGGAHGLAVAEPLAGAIGADDGAVVAAAHAAAEACADGRAEDRLRTVRRHSANDRALRHRQAAATWTAREPDHPDREGGRGWPLARSILGGDQKAAARAK